MQGRQAKWKPPAALCIIHSFSPRFQSLLLRGRVVGVSPPNQAPLGGHHQQIACVEVKIPSYFSRSCCVCECNAEPIEKSCCSCCCNPRRHPGGDVAGGRPCLVLVEELPHHGGARLRFNECIALLSKQGTRRNHPAAQTASAMIARFAPASRLHEPKLGGGGGVGFAQPDRGTIGPRWRRRSSSNNLPFREKAPGDYACCPRKKGFKSSRFPRSDRRRQF